ncbi:MAG TPA: DUF5686 family protein [Gemmatimonadales bacterium]|jgi:hypothetical protein
MLLAPLLLLILPPVDQDTALDAPAIVARAIARREQVPGSLRSARYDAWMKFTARDIELPEDSSASVLVLSQTHSAAYWEPSDTYLETISARRQVHGRGSGGGLVMVSEIADALRDDIVLTEYAGAARGTQAASGRGRGGSRSQTAFHLISPVARDAPTFYDYAIQDTLVTQGRRVLRIAVEPKSEALPLFRGTMDIADSTFDLLALDLSVNGAVQFATIDSLRYAVHFTGDAEGRWLPDQVRLTGELHPRVTSSKIPRSVLGFRLDMVPRQIAFEQVASLGKWRLDAGPRPNDAGEYRVVVLEAADRQDSTLDHAPDGAALTAAQETVMLHSDSLQHHPHGVRHLAQDVGDALRLAEDPGFFHDNRVDGLYLGAAHDWHVTPALSVLTKAGYGFGSETWQYRLGGQLRLAESRRVWVGGWYHDETVSRPTLTSYGYNPVNRAFFARSDPLDYYRERGATLALGARLPGRISMQVGYDDVRQSTLDTIPGFAPRNFRTPPRDNPAIVDGTLRDVSLVLTWDSRQMIRTRGIDTRINGSDWTRISLGTEIAEPSVIPDDFTYRRYTVAIQHQQRTFGIGNTTISLAAGTASDRVPPQRYFTVDFGRGVLTSDGAAFNTLSRLNFYGNSAAMLVLRHDFGHVPFARSGIGLLRRLPFTVSINGGAFWTDFTDHTADKGDSLLQTAPHPYTEAGFSLGNLTPFLSPFDLSARFSWQLSDYPTHRFRFEFGFSERW